MPLRLVGLGSVGLDLNIEIFYLESAHDFENGARLVEVVVDW